MERESKTTSFCNYCLKLDIYDRAPAPAFLITSFPVNKFQVHRETVAGTGKQVRRFREVECSILTKIEFQDTNQRESFS